MPYDYVTGDWYDDDSYYQPGDNWTDSSGHTYTYDGSSWQLDNDSGSTGTVTTTNTDQEESKAAIPDGGVDAQGNPTYVNAAGYPVTADGTLIPSANTRTPIEGGGFRTLNPNGSVTYEDPDGSVYTVNPSGTYTTAGGTYDPKTGKFTDPSGASNSNLSALMNAAKGFFQKKDASGKPTGEYDWGKIAGFGAAAYGVFGGDKPKPGGWQGSIPKYTATRQEIEYNDPNRVPGSGGRKYFTDVQYGAEGAAPAAQAAAQSQAQSILSHYTPAAAPVNKWGVGALKPAVATPWAKPVDTAATARPAETTGIANSLRFMSPAARTATNPAQTPSGSLGDTPEDSRVVNNWRGEEEVWEKLGDRSMVDPSMVDARNTRPGSNIPYMPVMGGNIAYTPEQRQQYENELTQKIAANPSGNATAARTTVQAAMGGIMPLASGRYLQGTTDGMADKIDTSIDGRQPAKLSHGEFVVPADVVSHLGNGNSDAGAKKLYSMMDKVRQARTGTKKQGKQINPDKYMPGGTVNKYTKGGIANLPVKKFTPGGTTGPATDTTTSSTLSPWVGDYVADYLGKGQALANQPYQAYKGPLTAGASDLQQQAFAGASNLASTGYDPTKFTSGIFGTPQAQQYMNPYLQTALNPQLDEMRRQSQINLQPSMAKLTQAGGFGGGRQAIMESEAARNLLAEQNKTVGQAYSTAYDKAMQQFNADQQRRMEADKASEASRQYGADYGLKSLQELEKAGATQRGITAEGIAADKAQFEEQREHPYKMVQYQQGLLQGLPITTQSNTQNMSDLTSLLANLGYGGKLQDLINSYLNPTK